MYSIVIYSFPLTLLVFEWGLRTILNVNSSGYTGPTLAAAGLSFLMPLIKPKLKEIPGETKLVAMSIAESRLIPFLWMFILIFLFAWASSCYVSIKFPEHQLFGFDSHLVIGGSLYAISLILTAIKENV